MKVSPLAGKPVELPMLVDVPGEIYRELTREFGEPAYDRVEGPGKAIGSRQEKRHWSLVSSVIRHSVCTTFVSK
ncbi:MAG TPA: hypothetical protein VGQ81_09935 [Acidobacteriota bacterium]|jgi:hypothetical protein|nr:hypothetical protein [Acidobacteriota bacterium]